MISFTRPIMGGHERHVSDKGKIRIPVGAPCLVVHVNKSHVWVKYNDSVYKLRNIKERMKIVKSEIAKVLYAD